MSNLFPYSKSAVTRILIFVLNDLHICSCETLATFLMKKHLKFGYPIEELIEELESDRKRNHE